MVDYKSDITIEDIRNHSICVKTKSGIRNMKFQEDIECDLVWVNNIIPESMLSNRTYTIKEGVYVRYTDVYVSPRSNKFL